MFSILQVPQIVAETINVVNATSSFNNSDYFKDILKTKLYNYFYEINQNEVTCYTYTIPIENFPISNITNITGVKIKKLYDDDSSHNYSSVVISPFGYDNLIIFGDNILKAEFLLLQDPSKLDEKESEFVDNVLNSLYSFYVLLQSDCRKFDPIFIGKLHYYNALNVANNIALACAYFTLYSTALTGHFDYVTIKRNIKEFLTKHYRSFINMKAVNNLFCVMQNKDFDDLHLSVLNALDPLFETEED